ncbi:MAG TPA: diguanylate cyclase [Geobacteraceae bacterium]|nr:diguanylate cyclase [Geobacteraceae bacterium]
MERILVVEDDRFFREMFSNLLRGEGYEVDTAASPVEALDSLGKSEYHLVVTDLVMPDMSGLDLLFRVKQHDPDIDVILVTGNANVESAIYALKNGARDYLIKPINHDEFKHAVSLCFEQRRLLNENIGLKSLVHLYQVGQTIANCLELERLNTLIIDSLAKEVGSGRALGLFPDSDDRLVLSEIRGFSRIDAEKLAEFMMPDCMRHQGTTCDFKRLDNYFTSDCGLGDSLKAELKEALIMFIRSKTVLQGVIMLFNNPDGTFQSEINYRNINFILDQSSLAFENAMRYAAAKNLLYIDELTGLFNYRYLDIALEREIKRADRYGSGLTVIFIDLDLFKSVNDKYGHLVGSRVLKEVGKLLKISVREVDLVIRYGGDEYTVILVETNASGAGIVAERIRSTIESHRFLAEEGHDIRLTACLGYASYPEDTRSKQELLDVADQAMYRGKESGRNMVFRALGEKQVES